MYFTAEEGELRGKTRTKIDAIERIEALADMESEEERASWWLKARASERK